MTTARRRRTWQAPKQWDAIEDPHGYIRIVRVACWTVGISFIAFVIFAIGFMVGGRVA